MKILEKAILLVFVILIIFALPISVGAQEIDVNVPTYTMVGDMDGKINIKDLVALKQELSKPTDSGGSGDIYFPGHW